MKTKTLKKPRVLLYDIETSPSLGYVWQKWETNVLAFEKEWEMLSFAYKWLGEKTVHCQTRKGKSDRTLVQKLWELFDQADVIIAHNGDAFDQKKAHARFAFHGLTPPSPYRTVDTVKVARKYFKFNSNKLDDLGKHLGVGRKVKHTGFDLWLGCMQGDKKSWATMVKYNKQDVLLLERVYLKLLPWIENHPHVGMLQGQTKSCPKCGHHKLKSCGIRHTKTSSHRLYRCMKCQGYSRARVAEKTDKPEIV